METFETILILFLIVILVYGTFMDNKRDRIEKSKREDIERKLKEFSNFVLDQKHYKATKEAIREKYNELFNK